MDLYELNDVKRGYLLIHIKKFMVSWLVLFAATVLLVIVFDLKDYIYVFSFVLFANSILTYVMIYKLLDSVIHLEEIIKNRLNND